MAAQRIALEGRVGLAEVPALARDLSRRVKAGDSVLDWSGVTAVDSSAVALAFELGRESDSAGWSLAHCNLPSSLLTLIDLYGVKDFVPAQT